jgi:hypothetical protein
MDMMMWEEPYPKKFVDVGLVGVYIVLATLKETNIVADFFLEEKSEDWR